MGATIVRLGFAGLRGRLMPAALTFVLIAAAAATVGLALQIHRVADDPWERTFRATNGAHVIASGNPDALVRVAGLPGVADATPPISGVVTTLRSDGRAFGLRALGLGASPPAIERPLVTDGRWVRGEGEIVLERSYARALGIGPGVRVTVATTEGPLALAVVGVAARAGGEPYPDSQPGAGFVTGATVGAIQPDPARQETTIALRLTDPGMVDETIGRAAAIDGRLLLESWQERRAEANDRNRITTIVLSTFSVIVLVAVALMVATFVAARVLQQQRELALLKAQGFTPRQLVAVGLVENLAVALAGSVAGVLLAAVIAPALVRRSADLVGSVPVSLDPLTGLFVTLAVVAVVALVTIVPVRRIGRATTMRVLAGADAPARARRIGLGRFLPLGIGFKQALARPGRTAAIVIALTLSVGSFVSVLAMEATLDREDAVETLAASSGVLPADPAGLAPGRPDAIAVPDLGREQIRPIVWGLNALLLAVIVANLLATTLLSARERTRETGVLRAVGVTPRQVITGLLASQTAIAAVAAAVGVPLGLALFIGVYRLANGSTEFVTMPPAWQLALVPVATVAAVALVALVPARYAARLRVVDALRRD